jgi:small subunit ribosomal protein S5
VLIVTKVTKGGRAFGFSAIVVVGDENGVVGHGLGNLKMFLAIAKAVEDAKKNLVKFLEWSISSSRTKGKFGGARVFLIPASHGTELLLVSCSFSFRISRYSRCII